MKEIEYELAEALRQQLERILSLEIESINNEWDMSTSRNSPLTRPDILAHVKMADRTVTLVCEVKEPAYPRQVRSAIDQLYAYMTR